MDPAQTLHDSWAVLVSAQRRLHEVRERTHRNFDGGDAGHQWDHGLVVRHAVNYAVAVRECAGTAIPGPMIDVGAGAGGFSVWAAQAMQRQLVIVDQDPGHRELAARAFPDIEVHASTGGLERAPVVLAMEVIEHIEPHEQAAFVREVAALVQPGGTLVLSTPDESGYWGGWSGYPPHVGCLDATELSRVLTTQLSGWDIDVLRLDGPGFELSRLGRYGVPVANRVWGKLDSRAPRLTHELAFRLNQLGKQRKGPPAPEPGVFRVGPARQGAGTGLVARAVRPA